SVKPRRARCATCGNRPDGSQRRTWGGGTLWRRPMTRHIYASTGQVIHVDDSDYEALDRFAWRVDVHGYANRSVKRRGKSHVMFMHREIINAREGQSVDHINHNKLDNRRANLRVCTKAENQRNQLKHRDGKSPYKGVYLEPRTGRWAAQIWVGGRNRGLG